MWYAEWVCNRRHQCVIHSTFYNISVIFRPLRKIFGKNRRNFVIDIDNPVWGVVYCQKDVKSYIFRKKVTKEGKRNASGVAKGRPGGAFSVHCAVVCGVHGGGIPHYVLTRGARRAGGGGAGDGGADAREKFPPALIARGGGGLGVRGLDGRGQDVQGGRNLHCSGQRHADSRLAGACRRAYSRDGHRLFFIGRTRFGRAAFRRHLRKGRKSIAPAAPGAARIRL